MWWSSLFPLKEVGRLASDAEHWDVCSCSCCFLFGFMTVFCCFLIGSRNLHVFDDCACVGLLCLIGLVSSDSSRRSTIGHLMSLICRCFRC